MSDDKKIEIFKTDEFGIHVEVQVDNGTVWLSQKQMAELFDKDVRTVNEHIQNVFAEKELKKKSVIRNFRIAASDGKMYQTKHYNLDVIISVGYRVKSQRGTQFRIWANSVLKQYLIEGYAINEKLLQQAKEKFVQLRKTVTFVSEKSNLKNLQGQESELLRLLNSYSRSLKYLDQFDQGDLSDVGGAKDSFKLTYDKAIQVIRDVKSNLMDKHEATDLFGSERGDSFQSVIGNIYQSFDGEDLYLSIEAKASHLLYFVIKDHPFSDGNKRSGSFLFVYYLDKNNYLYKDSGEKKFNDNALTALALLVAESDPKEKEMMIKLIMNLISD